ncbi:hypothetical protein [Weissella viridescens]|uniref:hypothetical protein n=1 Tax=Weissella viridescens TaxID=1629 RepID=UPI0035275902
MIYKKTAKVDKIRQELVRGYDQLEKQKSVSDVYEIKILTAVQNDLLSSIELVDMVIDGFEPINMD